MKLYVHSCDSRFPLTHVATISDDGSDTLGVGVCLCAVYCVLCELCVYVEIVARDTSVVDT